MIIRRETLAAVLHATTAKDTRYFLDALNVKPDGTVEGTNGHIAIQATDKAPYADEDFPVIEGREAFHGNPEGNTLIPADIVRAMIASMPKRATLPILQCAQLAKNGNDGTATMVVTDLQAARVAKIEANGQTFPAIDRVMPAADKPAIVVCLAVDVLEAAIKAAKAIHTGKTAALLTLAFRIPSDTPEVMTAVRIETESPEVSLVMAAMPCRL